MIEKVQHFINQHQLLEKKQQLIVGVSAGIDSMVLLHILAELGYQPIIAHCNFCLRKEDADADESFVKEQGKAYSKEILVKHFDTEAYSKQEKISIQEAARDIRYEWFNVLSEQYNCPIAVAHHLDDQIETFYFNLIRGTGIKGLTAMSPENGNIIRPFLEQTRKEIKDYALKENIPWREDKSNESDKYSRNYIRHHIVPSILKLNKSYHKTFLKELEIFKATEHIYTNALEQFLNQQLKLKNKKNYLLLSALKEHIEPEAVLHYWLSPYGFDNSTIKDIIASLSNQKTALTFYGKQDYKLIKERNNLVLFKKSDPKKVAEIKRDTKIINSPISLKMETFSYKSGTEIDKNSNTAYLDLDKLNFPLQVRQWKARDYFYPLGMKNKKKLSDFFIDNKIEQSDKEYIFLLCSNDDIIWLIGQRIDDRYKITSKTKHVFKINIF